MRHSFFFFHPHNNVAETRIATEFFRKTPKLAFDKNDECHKIIPKYIKRYLFFFSANFKFSAAATKIHTKYFHSYLRRRHMQRRLRFFREAVSPITSIFKLSKTRPSGSRGAPKPQLQSITCFLPFIKTPPKTGAGSETTN